MSPGAGSRWPASAQSARRVITVITRLDGGAGAHAVRGLEGLDRDAFGSLIITGSGGRLLD